MTRLPLALPLLLAAGCATSSTPYAPVRDVAYQAIGSGPFWALAIGDDSIVLRTADGERRWPRVLPRTVGETRVWRSGDGPEAITITARRDECRSAGGQAYRDNVMVRAPGAGLTGCGGPLLGRESR